VPTIGKRICAMTAAFPVTGRFVWMRSRIQREGIAILEGEGDRGRDGEGFRIGPEACNE
jgi:hypothetical protein